MYQLLGRKLILTQSKPGQLIKLTLSSLTSLLVFLFFPVLQKMGMSEQRWECSDVGWGQPTTHCYHLKVSYDGNILIEQHRPALLGMLNFPEENKHTLFTADG